MTQPLENADTRAEASNARPWPALALAVVALAAALFAAVGPAESVRTTYSWPPDELPAATPARLWYTPLLLIRHQPEALAASLPCSLPRPLPAAERPLTVLATARKPDEVGGLAVTRAGDQLVVGIGSLTLGRVPVADDRGSDECSYRLRVEAGTWSLEGGPDDVTLGGSLDAMPVVNGLFSALDLRSGASPSVDVTTSVHATETTILQTLGWVVAALAAASALILVAAGRGPRRLRALTSRAVRASASHLHPADAAVALVLLAWWVIAPVIWDDGWVVARARTFSESGGFSTYYSAFGVNLPLDYWVEWLQHWVTGSSVVLLLRLPALLCLAATWVLCRYVFGRLAAPRPGRADVALWTLSAAFLLGALAWGMTLRPEPVVALLATGVMACAIRFSERETAAPVAVAGVLIALALTAHHTGIVALAPVLAVSPRLLPWARLRPAAASTIVVASGALLLTLAFVGSDLGQRLADAEATRDFGITTSWRTEIQRYQLLADFPWGAPLRRASVVLIGLALLAFLLWRRRNGRRSLDHLPATMLLVSLVLLVGTPSKIPWHFGALIGMAAVAIAAEAARIREEGAAAGGWRARPFLIVGAAIAAAAWWWFPRHPWNPVDLRTLGWDPGLDAKLPYSTIAVALPAVVLAGALLYTLGRGRQDDAERVPWQVASWTTPLAAITLIVFTAGMLVADAVRTNGWTLTRQNLESIAGDEGCGLADDTYPAIPSTARPLVPVTASDRPPPPAWVPSTPVAGVPRFELPAAGPGAASTPWFRLPAGERFGLFVAGPSGASDRLALEWGRLGEGRVDRVAVSDVAAVRENIETGPWIFIAASELPTPDERADAVRVTLPNGAAPQAAVAVTAPVTYETERLDSRLAGRSALVHPNLLLYFPCVQQPRLADGVVEAPQVIVWFDHPFAPHPYEATSPFLGIRDLYEVDRLPITDGESPPTGVVVFEVDAGVSGGVKAPPDAS